MLREAIEKLSQMAVDSAKPFVVHEDAEHVRVWSKGEIQLYAKDNYRNHIVKCVDDFCSAITAFGNDQASVWIDENAVIGLFDGGSRRDKVLMPLEYSPTFSRLMQLDNEKLDQRGLIQLLRYELTGVAGVESILSAVRSIKFRTGQTGHTDIQHGRESMGREVDAEVTGAGAIPDEATVQCRVFSNLREVFALPIRCFLQVFPEQQKFTFRAAGGELDEAVKHACEDMRGHIEGDLPEVHVFFGRP